METQEREEKTKTYLRKKLGLSDKWIVTRTHKHYYKRPFQTYDYDSNNIVVYFKNFKLTLPLSNL